MRSSPRTSFLQSRRPMLWAIGLSTALVGCTPSNESGNTSKEEAARPSRPEGSLPPKSSGKTPDSASSLAKDDSESVKKLTEAGFRLVQSSQGVVTEASVARDAASGELLKLLKGCLTLKNFNYPGRASPTKAWTPSSHLPD